VGFGKAQFIHKTYSLGTTATSGTVDDVFFIFIQCSDLILKTGVCKIHFEGLPYFAVGYFFGCAYIQKDDIGIISHHSPGSLNVYVNILRGLSLDRLCGSRL
jgi:hypothetical protein